MTFMLVGLLALILVLAIAVLGLFYVRFKFRLLWARQAEMVDQLNHQQQALVQLKKSQILQGLSGLRLPAAMPSQHGEDIVLANFFNFKRSGLFVEVGAYHGVELSNSYFFEALGWDGWLFEPNPKFCAAYPELRPFSKHINAAVLTGEQETVELTTVPGELALSYSCASQRHLDRIAALGTDTKVIQVKRVCLSEVLGNIQQAIDFISIDVEGAELEVLKTIDFELHRPSVFLIEDNSHGQDQTVCSFMRDRGYQLRLTLGCNDFYLEAHDPRGISLVF